MNPTRRRRRHLSSEEREDAFRAAAAREAGAAPKGGSGSDTPADKGSKQRNDDERAPRPRRRHSSGTQQKPSVPSVADQVSDGEVKVTRRRPGDGGGGGCQGRARRCSRRTRVARRSWWRGFGRPGPEAPSPSSFPQAASRWWRGFDPVFVCTTTAYRRIAPANGFNLPDPKRVGVP